MIRDVCRKYLCVCVCVCGRGVSELGVVGIHGIHKNWLIGITMAHHCPYSNINENVQILIAHGKTWTQRNHCFSYFAKT